MFDHKLPESIHEFNAHIDYESDYELIKLPSGEYASMAEVYLAVSPTEYFKDLASWLDATGAHPIQ